MYSQGNPSCRLHSWPSCANASRSCLLDRCCWCGCCTSAFPSSDILQMGSTQNKHTVFVKFPPKTSQKNCMWLLLLINIRFIFFFLYWISTCDWAAFSSFPAPAIIRLNCINESPSGTGVGVCVAFSKVTSTPFVTAGGKLQAETGSLVDTISWGSNLSTKSIQEKYVIISMIAHVGVGANELNEAVLAKEVGENVCFFSQLRFKSYLCCHIHSWQKS